MASGRWLSIKMLGVAWLALIFECMPSEPLLARLHGEMPGLRGSSTVMAPRHLYLTSLNDRSVYSFPLKNGIPSRSPDAVITGFSAPAGVAVDNEGYLYVSDAGTSTVDVFAPGANGPAQPIRQLPVYLGDLISWQNYLIAQDKDDGVNVYRDEGDGVPFEPIPSFHASLGMAVEPDGRLFLSWLGVSLLNVYHTALPPNRAKAPIKPAQAISLADHYGFSAGLAVDDRDIFAEVNEAGPVRIAVLPINAQGVTKPRRVMITPVCNAGAEIGSYAFAMYAGYLYEACAIADSVFIFDKRRSGHTQPLFTLSGPFPSVLQIALGP
jgi:hypothetical protein